MRTQHLKNCINFYCSRGPIIRLSEATDEKLSTIGLSVNNTVKNDINNSMLGKNCSVAFGTDNFKHEVIH